MALHDGLPPPTAIRLETAAGHLFSHCAEARRDRTAGDGRVGDDER